MSWLLPLSRWRRFWNHTCTRLGVTESCFATDSIVCRAGMGFWRNIDSNTSMSCLERIHRLHFFIFFRSTQKKSHADANQKFFFRHAIDSSSHTESASTVGRICGREGASLMRSCTNGTTTSSWLLPHELQELEKRYRFACYTLLLGKYVLTQKNCPE